ncbi:hypothetical protein EDB89DRAFT_2085466 [Lactarius sanguifluus]|nr:hypothetical protein EDB89DRAFT_2085466 [Lactarius sanguifluus]
MSFPVRRISRFSRAESNTLPRVSHALPALTGSLVLRARRVLLLGTIGRALHITNADVIQFMLDARVIGSALCQLRSALDVFEG